jgi:hypothetical protein
MRSAPRSLHGQFFQVPVARGADVHPRARRGSAAVHRALLTLCKDALGAAPADFVADADALPPDVARWVLDNDAVLRALPAH